MAGTVRLGGPLRRIRAAAVATAVLLPTLGADAPHVAAQSLPSLSAAVSSSPLRYGSPLTVSGRLEDEPACAGSRTLAILRQPAGSALWEALGEVTTAGDGSYAFLLPEPPAHTASYRAEAAATEDPPCLPATSDPVEAKVVARVEAALRSARVGAGDCAAVDVRVSPAKPGQEVVIQERWSHWRAVAVVVLDSLSSGSGEICGHGWADIGKTFRVRARWERQDPTNEPGASPAVDLRVVKAAWMRRIDDLIGRRSMSVSVREQRSFLYRRSDEVLRIPASNQKLLLSMALLDRLGPGHRFATRALAPGVDEGVIRGDLWIVGRGDPSMGRRELRVLARRIARAGVTRVKGSVMGSRDYFARDWWATGWRSYFPSRYVALPTALTFEGNRAGGRHIRNPELRAARFLTRALRDEGVRVRGAAGWGLRPPGLLQVARVESPTVLGLVGVMDRYSSNFYAEVLGKRLGVRAAGTPGTIAKGATAVQAWAADRGAAVAAYDGSGLSYANRVSAAGMVRLLGRAEREDWGPLLRGVLPTGGQGTLTSRLHGVPVRAKTGTLSGVSALSGWVWLERRGAWAEFSILSAGMSKSRAVEIEDRIVRILRRRAN